MGSRMSQDDRSPAPPVSVVIPALNAAGALERAIRSVKEQDYQGPVEIVVAVGPSNDETEEIARALDCIVVPNPSGRTPSALNAAIKASSGSIIVRLDAYATLPQDYLRRAVATSVETGAANVGGVQLATGRGWFQRAVAMAQSHVLGVGDARYRRGGGEPGPVDTVYLGVFDRRALEAVGGFDERYVRNQDYELNWRLRAAGHTVWFDPSLVVAYSPRASPIDLARQYYSYGRWKRFMLTEHPRSLKSRQLAPPLLVIGLLGSAGLATAGRLLISALLPATYAATLVAVGGARWIQTRDSAAAGIPVALAIMHISWGVGFIRGGARP